MKRKKRKFIFNCDGSDEIASIKEKPDKDDLIRKVFFPLEGSQVDTLFYMQGIGNIAEYKSDILHMPGHINKYNFNSISTYKRYANSKHFIDKGEDTLDIIIEGARERYIDVFFSLRLNDIHDHSADNIDFMPDFKIQHPEWMHPKEYFPNFYGTSLISTALNYVRNDVREFRLEIIKEVMGNYDFDGLELDFMRSPFYFHWDKGLCNAFIMTDFVRQVRKILNEEGEKRGKYLELAVRVYPTVIGSYMGGFDVGKWAKEELIDIVIAGNGGMNIDTKGYKQLLKDTGVSFFPCLYGDYERIASSDEVMRGVSEVLLMDEPDGIYTFNLYPTETRRYNLLREIGSLKTLEGLDKTYIVDMDYDYILTREEWRYGMHLPITLGETKDEWLEIPIRVGEDLSKYDGLKLLQLKVWIKDLTEDDEIDFMFNDVKLDNPFLEPVKGEYLQYWRVWDIDNKNVRKINEVKIKLRKRNQYLVKFVPAVVQRINIDVKF